MSFLIVRLLLSERGEKVEIFIVTRESVIQTRQKRQKKTKQPRSLTLPLIVANIY